MTIKRGQAWGESSLLPDGAPVARNDAELAALASQWLLEGGDPDSPHPDRNSPRSGRLGESGADEAFGPKLVFGLTGGDLHRTVGSPGRTAEQLSRGEGIALPVDVGLLEYESVKGLVRRLFVAHLVATADKKGRRWRGRSVIAMNASFIGTENLAPRGHPNDGRLDITDGELAFVDRRRAYDRTYAGTHVPHPDLTESRVRQIDIEHPVPLYLSADGVFIGSAATFSLRCIADALTIIV